MSEKTLLTQEGYDKIVAEHDYLVSVRRKEVAEHLKEARSYGDLSENAEYDAAKNEQAELEEKIQKLEAMMRDAEIIDHEELTLDAVGVSLSVTVKNRKTKDVTTYKIVPTPEADPFAAMAYEDSRNASRKASRKAGSALWLGGAVGGNEAGTGGAAYAAKSSNPNYIENSIVENSASNYGIPVSFGAGVKMGFTERLSASAGVDYSFLSRSFNGTYTPAGSAPTVGEISHEMRYIGIPVGVYYNLISKGNVGFYLFGLGEAEWCLGNSYNIAGTVVSEKVAGTQFSAGGGFGVEFRLSPTLSLYADPAVRYYFDCGHPNNIRSEKQLMLNFNAGLRFNL